MLNKLQNLNFLKPNYLASEFNQPNYKNFNFYSFLHLLIGILISFFCFFLYNKTSLQSYSLIIGVYFGLWMVVLTTASYFFFFLKNKFAKIFQASLFVFCFFFFYQLLLKNFSFEEISIFVFVVFIFHIFSQKFKIAVLFSIFVLLLLTYSFLFIKNNQPFSKLNIFLFVFGICITIDVFYYIKDLQNKYYRERSNYLYHISSGYLFGFIILKLSNYKLNIIEVSSCVKDFFESEENLNIYLNNQLDNEDYKEINEIMNVQDKVLVKQLKYNKHILQFTFSKLILEQGSFITIHTENITERILEKEKMMYDKIKYQNLYNKNQSGVFSLQTDATIIACNDTFIKIFDNTLEVGDLFFKTDEIDKWNTFYSIINEEKSIKNYQIQYKLTNNVNKWLIFNFYFNSISGTIEGNVLDVTELQKANLALQQSEEKYRLVYETSNDVIFLLDDDIIVNTNRKGTQLFGITEEELINKSFWNLSNNNLEELKHEIKKIKERIYQSRITKFNWQFKGKYRPIDAEVAIAELVVGNQIYHQCVIHDISDKIEAIKVLEKSAKNFKNTLENIPEGIIIIHENKMLYNNDEVYKLIKNDTIDIWNLFNEKDQFIFNNNLDFDIIKKTPFQQKLSLKNTETNRDRIVDITIVHTEYENQNCFLVIMKDYSLQHKLDQEMIRTKIAEETNIRLGTEISERIRTENELENLLLKTKSIYDSSNYNLVMTLDRNFTLTYINNQVKHYFTDIISEIQEGEDFFKYLNLVFDVEKTLYINKKINEALNGKSSQLELDFQSKKGIKWLNAFVNPIYDNEGNISEISIVAHDVTNKKQYEKEITDSLKEKEILLKEIHHRVKNNLQVISSILSLQCSYISDEGTLEVLQESRNRIRSMAIIHENLYQTTNFSSIDFAGYIKNLVTNLRSLYYNKHTQVVINYELEEVDLILDQAVPCGLIMNELITNALKYAVEPNKLTIITISVKVEGNTIYLRVSDNGKGMPEGMIIENNDSLGLQLVQTLVEQLDGSMEYNSNKGTNFLIKFEKQTL